MANWANTTDYAKLHGRSYFGKSPGVASFLPGEVVPLVERFAKFADTKNVLDIGSGSGRLSAELSKIGYNCLGIDYEPIGEKTFDFDLSRSNNIAQTANIRNYFGEDDYVSTCFDVLEHIDQEDIANCVYNLNQLVSKYIIVSISTRPSSRGNAFHSSVVPIQTWCDILKECGFNLIKPYQLNYARRLAPKHTADETQKAVACWSRADLFGDYEDGEPNYYLFEKIESVSFDAFEWNINRILDLNYKAVKRSQLSIDSGKIVGFNIHHFQDFVNVQPIVEALPRDQVSVFIRDVPGLLKDDEIDAIEGFFKRNGVMTTIYKSVGDATGGIRQLDVLLSFAESTVSWNHRLSRHLVSLAHTLGVPTMLMQHGIWVEAPKSDTVLSFASRQLLSWGHEHKAFFEKQSGRIGHYQGSNVDLRNTQVQAIGCAKFSDMLAPSDKSYLKTFLGIEHEKYDYICLLGTNLYWCSHSIGKQEVIRHFNRLIKNNKNIFFILKTHPSERVSRYSQLTHSNLMKIDEILMTYVNITYSRLMSCVDIVISSLSTMLLDGAVAGAKCLQYDTKNQYSYEYCDPISLEDLCKLKLDTFNRFIPNEKFVAYYADHDHTDFYVSLAALINSAKPLPVTLDVATAYCDMSVYDVDLVQLAELERVRNSFRAVMTRNFFRAVMTRNSWKITAPIRSIIRLAKRLWTLGRAKL